MTRDKRFLSCKLAGKWALCRRVDKLVPYKEDGILCRLADKVPCTLAGGLVLGRKVRYKVVPCDRVQGTKVSCRPAPDCKSAADISARASKV